ncbi:hypothetical protein [Helicobacter pylori]|uniref:hypothetical protein n=1 Tax=Helicobacter pylori TaxID=210 RepID=UPI000EAC308D|nr:hypothetical protein [Helicobacter pylori]RKV47824.1 hypothetical protein DD767_00760 [Helicobacter pylori]
MRQEHETATSFNELKAITQAIMLKKNAQENATDQATDQATERMQEANNANAKAHAQEPTQEISLKPKATTPTKKGRLNPTKKAFSERQNTAFRDNSQAGANLSRGTKGSYNANAFKTEQANNNFKPGLAKHQENQKGSDNEA